MLAEPTKFTNFKNRPDSITGIIVKLTDETTTWLLGNLDAKLDEGFVYNMIVKFGGIKQKIDIYERTWSNCIVDITFSNVPYVKDSNGNTRLSEKLTDIVDRAAYIYFCNNPNITSLNDCIIPFSGKVKDIKSYNEKEIRIRLIDNSEAMDTIILRDYMNDYISDIPVENEFQKAPLIYGDYGGGNHGMAKCFRQNTVIVPKYVAAGHNIVPVEVEGKNPLYIPIGAPPLPPVAVDDYYFVETTYSASVTFAHIWHMPNQQENYTMTEPFNMNAEAGVVQPPYDVAPFTAVQLEGPPGYFTDTAPRVYDGVLFSGALHEIHLEDEFSGLRHYTGYIVWEIDDATRFKSMLMESSDITNPRAIIGYINIQLAQAIIDIDWDAYSEIHVHLGLLYGGDSDWVWPFPLYASWDQAWVLYGNLNEWGPGDDTWGYASIYPDYIIEDNITRDFAVISRCVWTNSISQSNPITAPWMAEICEMELQLKYEFIPTTIDNPVYHAWITCQGRKMGSYASYFSTHSLNDLIEDPGMIIVSLLQDIPGAGKSGNYFNVVSFNESFFPYFKSRINIVNEETTIKEVAEQLGKQSLSTFVWLASGKARWIPLRMITQQVPTDVDIIKFDEITDGKIIISKTNIKYLYNKLTVKSRWLSQEDRFADEHVFINQTSIDRYGEREKVLEFENIDSSDRSSLMSDPVAIVVANLITPLGISGISANDGFWSSQHPIIKLSIAGFSHAKLEVGDWIELDNITVGPHIRLFNESSWTPSSNYNKRFIITNINHNEKGTDIEAMNITRYYNLYDIYGTDIIYPLPRENE